YNIEYGAETSVQSALNLIYLLAFQPAPGHFSIFGESDERFHIADGNESLPPASIKLKTPLAAIAKNDDGTFTLKFKGASSIVADRVVLALPFSVLRTLDYRRAGFSDLKTLAIESLGYGTNAKLHLQFDTRLWNQQGPWGIGTGSSFADTGYQNTW